MSAPKVFILLAWICPYWAAQGQPVGAPPGHEPKICLGHLHYGGAEHWGPADDRGCPPGMAIYGGEVGVTRQKPAVSSLPFEAVCCPLPANDILTDDHIAADEECPPDSVATGAKRFDDGCPHCPRPLRCTKINTVRYQLAQDKPAAAWGFGTTFWRSSVHYKRSELPAAIRTGIARSSRYFMRTQGCIGQPFGSLLAARKARKGCDQVYFRELQFRGIPGDPPAGTPVQMYPDCRDVSDYFGSNPQCIK